ncbi:MAG: Fic family protein [Bacilli bacterium]|nr:Fic family protein [Bacillales bacterium]MDY2574585.1 Fic family protein [Bacilli bacterium]
MENNFVKIQELLNRRAEFQTRLNFLPYDGTPEVKTISGKRYLYVRKRKLDKVKSTYVGEYSEELYNVLLKNNVEAKSIRKEVRHIDKELALLGYKDEELSERVILNLEFARSNMKKIIYDQAVLEGVATTFPDTEKILENGVVKNVKAEDVLKIINLKHAWQFILDKDVIQSRSDYYLASYIAKLVNEGLLAIPNGGQIRNVPVTIGGSTYIPPIPLEYIVKQDIIDLLDSDLEDIDKAIELCLYVMKTQIYNDGNKRTAIIYANHYLISKGQGLLVIDYNKVSDFKKLLVSYYEDKDLLSIKKFLKECWIKF